MHDVIVVGGGISGLSAAYFLTRDSKRSVLLLEAGERAGGKVRTCYAHGLQMECGPNTCPNSSENILKLCRKLDISPQAAASGAKSRYIVFRKKLQRVPTSPLEIITTPLLSPGAKFQLFAEPFQPKRLDADESVASFAKRRLGQQVLDNLLGPFLSGIYAGDPELLSLPAIFPKFAKWEKEQGSLLKGLLAQAGGRNFKSPGFQLLSFPGGMNNLINALQCALPEAALQVKSPVASVESANGAYILTLSNGRRYQARSVILATPADAAANILQSVIPDEVCNLEQIPYVPLYVVHIAYQKKKIPNAIEGFGFLVSKADRHNLLGCVWASCLFPEKAPADQYLFSCYVTGYTPEQTDQEIIGDLNAEFQKILKAPHLTPVRHQVIRHEKAIPQYNLGHLNRIKNLEESLSSHPGLFLAGNYVQGVSLDSCVESGLRAAERADAYLTHQ